MKYGGLCRKCDGMGLETVNLTSPNISSVRRQSHGLGNTVFLETKEEKERVSAYKATFLLCKEVDIFILTL